MLRELIEAIFGREKNESISVEEVNRTEMNLCINAYAIFTVIDFIATMMSSIELQTFYGNVNKTGLEWHRLNVKPNVNQNAPTFWKEFWCKLLYYQEVLVVPSGDQMIIADDFTHHPEYAIKEDIFEQVSRGDLTFRKTFKASEVFYLKYSSVQIDNALKEILNLYSGLISHASEVYASSGGEKGILNVNSAANGPKEFEEKYGEWLNRRFKSYFAANNAVMPLFRGMTYTGRSSDVAAASVSAVIDMLDAAISKAANAYKVPPALLKGEVAGTADALDMLLTSCIDPLAHLLATEITAKEFTADQIASGSFVRAFTNNIKHTDIFDVAINYDKLFSVGFSHNELGTLLGLPYLDEEWANEHYVTLNYQNVPMPEQKEGGE